MEQQLYNNVSVLNIRQIKALHRAGAGLEWISADGKTPLIEACAGYRRYDVAKTLIELGANVNAYRPGRFGGTPLHHAAEYGLVGTVKLLLSSGAIALILNDDSKTPLDIAKAKGYTNIVREIEKHSSLFAGWLRQVHGPCIGCFCFPTMRWVVIMPRAAHVGERLKLELLIYAGEKDTKPCKIVPLWKANLNEPNFDRSNPTAIIYEPSTSTRLKLTPASEDKKHRLKSFCNACKGIKVSDHASNNQRPSDRPSNNQRPNSVRPSNNQRPSDRPFNNQGPNLIHPSNNQRPNSIRPSNNQRPSDRPSNNQRTTSARPSNNQRPSDRPSNIQRTTLTRPSNNQRPSDRPSNIQRTNSTRPSNNQRPSDHPSNNQMPLPNHSEEEELAMAISASLVTSENERQRDLQNEYVDIVSVIVEAAEDLSPHASVQEPDSATIERGSPVSFPSCPPALDTDIDAECDDKNAAPCCIICLDGPVEGACIPCGHMMGCMSCLNKLKDSKRGCPVCRAEIDRVARIYSAV